MQSDDDNSTAAAESISRIVSCARKSYSCILDDRWLAVLLDNASLWNDQTQLKFRHVASRFITEISNENLEYCTRVMKYIELRHIDNVSGYLGIRDFDEEFIYLSSLHESFVEDAKLINTDSDLITSTNQSFIRLQSYFFERVWSLAIPAMQKIAEIERVVSGDKIQNEVMRDPSEIISTIAELVESSRSEILVIFPYASVFWCAERAGLTTSLGNKIKRNVVVRAIVHIDKSDGDAEAMKERVKQNLRSKNNDLYASILFLPKDLRVSNLFFIVDQVTLISTDIPDSTKKTLPELVGETTFTSNESKIGAAISTFDNLWIQEELEKQSHAKQAYFNIFKGFKLQEEKYRRRRLVEQKGARRPRKLGTAS
jgi:hypothetical protein